MKFFPTLILICSLISPVLNAGSNGTSSAQFLSLGAGPKAIAMGELGVAASEDSYAAYWNPAGLASITEPEMAIMHNQHFENISQQYLVYAQPLLTQSALAVSLTRLASDPIDTYDVTGARTGSINTSDLSLSLSAAQLLSSSLSLGGSLKWIKQDLGAASASTAGFDIGLNWRPSKNSAPGYLKKLKTGLMISNLGPGLKFDSERFNLPTTLRLGIGYEDLFRRRPTLLGFETAINAQNEAVYSIGTEHWVTRSMALRAGYKSAHDFGSGLRLGFGFKIANIMLDYAWAGFGDIGTTHRLGFLIRFGNRQQPRYQVIRGPQNEIPSASTILSSAISKESKIDSLIKDSSSMANLPIPQQITAPTSGANLIDKNSIPQQKHGLALKSSKPATTALTSDTPPSNSHLIPTKQARKIWLVRSIILGSAIWLAYRLLRRYR